MPSHVPSSQVAPTKQVPEEDLKRRILADSLDVWHDADMPAVFRYLRGSKHLVLDDSLKTFLDQAMWRCNAHTD